jgi:hypothetical protein
MFQSYKNAETILALQFGSNVDRKYRILYCDSDGEEQVWSGYASRPEPEFIPGSTFELLSLQQEQLSDWAYDLNVAYEAYKRAQQTQDPPEQQTQASAEPPAEKKKMTRKRCRSAASKPERKQHLSTSARKERTRHTAAVSHKRPSMDLLEQSPQVLLRRVFSSMAKRANIRLWGITLHAFTMLYLSLEVLIFYL